MARSVRGQSMQVAIAAGVIVLGAIAGLGLSRFVTSSPSTAEFAQPAAGADASQVGVTPGFGFSDAEARLFDPQQPLMVLGDPVEASAREAATKSGRAIYLPEAPPGDGHIWFSNVTGEVAARFGTTLAMEFNLWEEGQDPAEEYAQQAADWKSGEATQVGGHPAWVVPPDEGSAGLAEIHITMGAWDIALYGKMTLDELRVMAENLVPTAPQG